jgi:hypothetical protein
MFEAGKKEALFKKKLPARARKKLLRGGGATPASL